MSRIKVREYLANLETITYLDDAENFLETFSFPRDLIEDVVRYPKECELDPRTHDVDYLVVRLRKGDITLSVSLRDLTERNAFVMYIHLVTPEDNRVAGKSRQNKPGHTGGKTPQTPLELQSHFRSLGCKLSNSANGVKITYGGRYVGTVHLTSHSRGGSPKSAFSMLMRNLRKVQGEIAAESITEHKEN